MIVKFYKILHPFRKRYLNETPHFRCTINRRRFYITMYPWTKETHLISFTFKRLPSFCNEKSTVGCAEINRHFRLIK